IDIGELEDFPSNTLPGFNERLSAWLPGLIEHRCSPGVRGGFLQRLETGTWPGHILEHVALELQTQAGAPYGYGRAREAGPRGVYKVIIKMPHEQVGRQSLQVARELIMAAIEDRPFDVAAAVKELTDLVDSRCVGPSTQAIVKAADDRDIPHIRLNSGNLVQLGHGAAQRRIWTAETDRTSAIAEGISKDKDLTKQLLATCGIPVPEGQVVESPQQAWAAAQDIGVPVCVKPGDGNRARGVSLDLRTQTDIETAYAIALEQGNEVIVEKFIPGLEHRLLVIGDRLVAASRGETASVLGDGQHTVRALVDQQINSDPRRGSDGSLPLEIVRLRQGSPEVLELQRQGLTPESVPEAGRQVLVKRTGNMTTDITDIVHPDVAYQAVLAARVIGLDIAGVDVVTPDITQPLEKVGGVVVEVNAGPSLLMHLNPAVGQARDVGKIITDHLFPNDDMGRIPLVGFMGDGETTRAAKLSAWLLHLKGWTTGLSCADGLYLNQRRLQAHGGMDFDNAQRLLVNRSVQAAVFETDARHLLTEGLPYDRCQIGVVTQMPKATGLQDLYAGEDDRMPSYIRTQIDVVLPSGVAILNAEDEAVAALAQYCDGEVMYYASRGDHPLLSEHRAAGKRVGFWHDGVLVLASGSQETEVLSAHRPAVAKLLKDSAKATPNDILVAACTAWALDTPTELIRAGIKSYGQNPSSF
ncbi:MAG: cyanophycin synthetase, partial [Betaproteobacteria bacterium]|nr:cyanophycin synthetase [Betaproteobacteria bacterium]